MIVLGKLIAKTADFIREMDKVMLILCLAASLFGCVAVFSATRYLESYRPVLVQGISLLFGICAAVVISMFKFDTFTKYWYLVAAVGLVPIILTFFIGFAPEGTDDKAWLNLGFTTFQPAELLKICFIVTFSMHLNAVKEKINKITVLILVCLHGTLPILLIHFQGDDGTAIIFAFMMICMLLAAGVSWKYFAAAFSTLLVISPLIYFFVMNDDQRARIINLFNFEANLQDGTFQQYRGMTALANGGLTGTGLLKGPLTSTGGVPYGQNDFIFVSIGEELGFLGCLAVILLLVLICFRTLYVARNCTKYSGKYICVGFFAMIFSQIIINIGMCISLLPVIGIPLPFFSAGGTSLLCIFLGVGLIMSVYTHRNSRTIYLHD